MALQIRSSVSKQLASSVSTVVGQMTPEQQSIFEEEYEAKSRNTVLMLILAIVFPIHFFFEDRIVLGVLFWLTVGGFFIWYVVEILTVWSRTKNHNKDVATTIVRDMKIMGAA